MQIARDILLKIEEGEIMLLFDAFNPSWNRFIGDVSQEQYDRANRLRAIPKMSAKEALKSLKEYPEDINPGMIFDNNGKHIHCINAILKGTPQNLIEYLEIGGALPERINYIPLVFLISERIQKFPGKEQELDKWRILIDSGMAANKINKNYENVIYAWKSRDIPDIVFNDVINSNAVMDYSGKDGKHMFAEFFRSFGKEDPFTPKEEELIRKVAAKVNLNPDVLSPNDLMLSQILNSSHNENLMKNIELIIDCGLDVNKKTIDGSSISDGGMITNIAKNYFSIKDNRSMKDIDICNLVEIGINLERKMIIESAARGDDFENKLFFGLKPMEIAGFNKNEEITSIYRARKAKEMANDCVLELTKELNPSKLK